MDSGLIPEVLKLLHNREEPSRNRFFEAFNTPANSQVLRYYKLIRSLEQELLDQEAHPRVVITPSAGGEVEVRVENPLLRYTRSCFLPVELFTFLAQRLARQGRRLPQALP